MSEVALRDVALQSFGLTTLLPRDPEGELLPAIKAYGLALLPYFPLASGLLTGKYRRNRMPAGARLSTPGPLAEKVLTEANWRMVESLQEFCRQRGRTLLELAFGWLAAQPAVSSIIAGATRPEQVEQNVKALEWALTPEDLAAVDRITKKP